MTPVLELLLAQAPSAGLWIPATAIVVAATAWCYRIQQQLTSMRIEMKKSLDNNTRAMRDVAHYFRWMCEETTGKKPPPPTPAVMERQ